MVHRVTTSDNEWKWVVQRVTKNDNKWQRVTMSGKEWQRVTASDTTRDNKWQWLRASDRSGTTNENDTVHFKELIIAILAITKTDKLLLQGMDGYN